MAVVKELIRAENQGDISFGNYELSSKAKKSDFEYQGDIYKVKTFNEITRLERNGMFVYESVPGTAVNHFRQEGSGLSFQVEGAGDVQITLEMEDDAEYAVYLDGVGSGSVKTNLGGKLVFSAETTAGSSVEVRIKKI